MDLPDSGTSLGSTSYDHDHPSQEDHYVTSISEDHEATCWGCGLRLLISPYVPVFKCGWCGAITNQNSQRNGKKYLWYRRLRDRCFVCGILVFMLFIICGGIWSIFPIVFSISYFCGVLHLSLAMILSLCTLSTFCLAAFRCPGTPPKIPWGSYPVVGKGDLDNYTFCQYCQMPKSPRAHHCRSCGFCVLDMDHHCPFIGNCVGAANHRCFIFFLISSVVSTTYASIMSSYAAFCIWPPLEYNPLVVLKGFMNNKLVLRVVRETIFAFFRSVTSLSVEGFVIVYLLIASVSVGIGLIMLLSQQLCYIYEGKTYLIHLSSHENDGVGERDCQNCIRFFGCPYSATRYLPSFWSSKKTHKK